MVWLLELFPRIMVVIKVPISWYGSLSNPTSINTIQLKTMNDDNTDNVNIMTVGIEVVLDLEQNVCVLMSCLKAVKYD